MFWKKWVGKYGRTMSRRQTKRNLQRWMKTASSVNVVLGAGGTEFDRWFSTDFRTLNITSPYDWQRLFEPESIDRLLAEHVLEHLVESECRTSLKQCYRYLKPKGFLRIAVPDGFHPDPAYIESVRPGCGGPGADDHKVLYNHYLLKRRLEQCRFRVEFLEYWDEHGKFHYHEWRSEDGHIFRSRRFDPRNQDGSLTYTSLIVDAIKPDGPELGDG